MTLSPFFSSLIPSFDQASVFMFMYTVLEVASQRAMESVQKKKTFLRCREAFRKRHDEATNLICSQRSDGRFDHHHALTATTFFCCWIGGRRNMGDGRRRKCSPGGCCSYLVPIASPPCIDSKWEPQRSHKMANRAFYQMYLWVQLQRSWLRDSTILEDCINLYIKTYSQRTSRVVDSSIEDTFKYGQYQT